MFKKISIQLKLENIGQRKCITQPSNVGSYVSPGVVKYNGVESMNINDNTVEILLWKIRIKIQIILMI